MGLFSPHIVEWFVVPLAMYLLLFWWRDNLNILHMPLADLVALLVVADVAIALNFSALPDVLEFLNADVARAPDSADRFWALAGFGVVSCWVLVNKIEKSMMITALHHISVGLKHKKCPDYLSSWSTFRNAKWQRFMATWALGFGVTAAVIAVHLVAVGIYALGPLSPYLAYDEGHWFVEALLSGAAIFFLFLALGALFTLIRLIRFSANPLLWTFSSND